MRPVSIPPPRLPPISALLRSIEPPQEHFHGLPGRALPPCDSFDRPDPLSPYSTSPPTPDVEVRSPFLPTPRSSPPSDFKPLVTFSSREAEHAGIAASQSRPVETPHPVPPGQLTSIAFPDGNALHPLPSGLAHGLSPMSSPRMSPALYASHPPSSSHPPRSTQRRRSITVTTPYLHQPSSALSATHNRRIYPAFATSSERRGSAGEGEGSISGGVGPLRSRRRLLEASYEGFAASPQRSSEADSPSRRQRALSISTTDEYRTLPPIWSSLVTQHPFRAPDASQQPARDGVDRDDRQSSTVTVGLSSLHITAPQSYRGHYTPSAIPPPPSSASATSHTTASGLRRLSIPTGLSTVAPSSAGSASATTSAGTSASSATSPLLQRAIPPPPQTWPVAPPPSRQSTSTPAAAADAMLAADGAVDAAAPNEVGRYACPHCPKRFARPSSLRIHTFSHTGEKPFTCPLCDRAFSVQSNLRRHLKIHKSGIGPVGPSRRGGGTAKASSLGPGASRGGGRSTDGDIDEDADVEGEAEPEDDTPLLGDAAASVDGEALPVPVRASFPNALLR
ncbi:hypothetical protein JCM21900_002142 [Sporobolomyces salmonicolor]